MCRLKESPIIVSTKYKALFQLTCPPFGIFLFAVLIWRFCITSTLAAVNVPAYGSNNHNRTTQSRKHKSCSCGLSHIYCGKLFYVGYGNALNEETMPNTVNMEMVGLYLV